MSENALLAEYTHPRAGVRNSSDCAQEHANVHLSIESQPVQQALLRHFCSKLQSRSCGDGCATSARSDQQRIHYNCVAATGTTNVVLSGICGEPSVRTGCVWQGRLHLCMRPAESPTVSDLGWLQRHRLQSRAKVRTW